MMTGERVYGYLMRVVFWAYAVVLAAVSGLRRGQRAAAPGGSRGDGRFVILATGTFFSSNWLRSHVLPLLASPACGRLVLVCDAPLLTHPRLDNRCPPAWLRQLTGRVPARALLLLVEALRCRPDYVMGYHLLPNGLLALLAGRLAGAKSIYQCCGGESELDGGGPAMFENGLLKRVRKPDPRIAGRLRSFVPEFDVIITRGQQASAFFERQARGQVAIISAGLDAAAYQPNGSIRMYDLIMVSRLVAMKRVDLFVQIVGQLVRAGMDVRAAIVGDGPERSALAGRIYQLGLERHILLAGQQQDVASWLHRAKVFVLPSDSEGLSIALAEAMMAGLPAVVSHVGDLPMLVADQVNGFLVPQGDVATFVDRVARLLRDDRQRAAFSARAREQAAGLCSIEEVTRRWTSVLRAAPAGSVRRRHSGRTDSTVFIPAPQAECEANVQCRALQTPAPRGNGEAPTGQAVLVVQRV